MKKLTFILLCFLIFGCEKQDTEQKYSANGTYKLIAAGKIERVYSGDNNQYSKDISYNLFDECSRNSTITINKNGTFEILEYAVKEGNCESENIIGTWVYKEILYNNALGEFKVNNSEMVYEIFSKKTTPDYSVSKIDVTHGSVLDDPSGRYIYTYVRVND